MHPALNYASQIAYSSKEVLQFSFDMAVKYRDSPGVYVECGVAAGAQIIAMAAGAPNKTIYAFDSFEGIPLPSNKDDQMPGIAMLTKAEQMALPDPGKQVLESSGATSVPIEHFWNHICQAFNTYTTSLDSNPPIVSAKGLKIQTVKGWFEDTVQHFKQDIAILRLDGDLYNSTYVCLKHLYPKVIKGGLVIIDDWALPGCREAVINYFYELNPYAALGVRMEFIEDKNSTVAYWTK